MRLWHESLLPYLDNKRLLGQHRECCALRGKGWNKKHSVVDYVFRHEYRMLYEYHTQVMFECAKRGYSIDPVWYLSYYHGKKLGYLYENVAFNENYSNEHYFMPGEYVYPEHDDRYLRECLENLKAKNAVFVDGSCPDEWLIRLDLHGK